MRANRSRTQTGHSVGFAVIDYNAAPRLRLKFEDTLAMGMAFNVEPGLYIEDYDGMRHCELVAVAESGMEVLTPFTSSLEELILAEPFPTSRAPCAATT
jgi:Xaa-Pro aminopeptidase